MENLNEILKGVLLGLATEFLIFIIITIIMKIKNSSVFRFIASSKIFGHGIECVYKEQSFAIEDIKKDIESTNNVKLFCMRGRSFIQTDAALSSMIESRRLTIQYLVLDPNSPFVDKRSKELNKPNYKKELETNIEELNNQTVGKSNIEKRKHNQPPVFRILILDNRVYFSFFENNKLGSRIPVFRAKVNSVIYKGLERYFEYIWEISIDI